MRRWMIVSAALCLSWVAACDRAQAEQLVPALEKLASQGNAEAIYHLGMMSQVGAGVARNPAKALEAFRKAAELGDPLGAYKLGCYYDGQGEGLVATDLALALEHKLVAAEAGYALAQLDVGGLLARKGEITAALVWLEKAAAQGYSGALSTYASVYNGMSGVPRDPVKTAAYFRLFLNRTQANDQQTQWLKDFEASLSPEQRKQTATIVTSYRPTPTPLTIKGLSGQRAAQALVAAK